MALNDPWFTPSCKVQVKNVKSVKSQRMPQQISRALLINSESTKYNWAVGVHSNQIIKNKV